VERAEAKPLKRLPYSQQACVTGLKPGENESAEDKLNATMF